MAKKIKFKIYNPVFLLVGVFFLVIVLSSIIPVVISSFPQKPYGVEMTQNFDVDSNLNGSFNQPYTVSVTGEIKNTNNKDIENITLHITLKVLGEKKEATIQITIPLLKAGEKYYVSEEYASKEHFSSVTKACVQVGDQGKQEMTTGSDMLFTLIGIIPMLIIPIFMLRIAFVKPKRKSKSQDDEDIEQIKAEFEKKIKKLKKAKKGIKCEYCGIVNKVDATRCEACGAVVVHDVEE